MADEGALVARVVGLVEVVASAGRELCNAGIGTNGVTSDFLPDCTIRVGVTIAFGIFLALATNVRRVDKTESLGLGVDFGTS